ncbi:MAG: ADP-ribosylglycohydrolase family protein [Clostridiales bacterium]|jgi:type I restriction enzyme M protein|nr:ADP-ribosylglycohydrolase family protein [Clostridiales bacterium]
MLGAIIGDIIGSRFEFDNHRSKDFELFHEECFFTDDSVMTIAVAKAIMESKGDKSRLGGLCVKYMQEIGQKYPDCGYGGRFMGWMFSDDPKPYNSYGNGAAMRVSPAGFAAKSLEEAEELAEIVTEVTHNHPEGIKGAKATAAAVYMARQNASKSEILKYIEDNYYPLDFMVDDIRDSYEFNETCQETVPQAIKCFLESDSFEDAIRTAISIGGDSDTVAAITGGIAGAYYSVPPLFKERAIGCLDEYLKGIYKEWRKAYPHGAVKPWFLSVREERSGYYPQIMIVGRPDRLYEDYDEIDHNAPEEEREPLDRPFFSDDELKAVQDRFHALVLERNEYNNAYLAKADKRLPKITNTTKVNDSEWYPVIGMYGGFKYRLTVRDGGPLLIVESWCRVSGGSGERHEITPKGCYLVSRGFV